jgi:outer membrane protein assembly factor BamB
MRKEYFLPLILALTLGISACSTVSDLFSEDDAPLPGERISILELEKELEPDDPALSATGFVAPSPWRNEFWPQEGGYPNHSMQNLALSDGELEKIWSASIGNGATKRLPLTAQPIVIEDLVFTLDTDSNLSAFKVDNGKRVWRISVEAEGEDDTVIGGGIAYSSGKLFVTTGYNELLAVNPDNGEILWRAPLPTPSRAAPTVMDERVFVTTLDNRLLALSSADGGLLWEHSALGESVGLIGAASPAANTDIVVPAFSSGEIFALRLENGSVAWSDNLSTLRSYGGLTALSYITGLPVMDKGLVIAVSFGGRLVAIDERTGSRVWQREIGSSETPWVAGNSIFLTTTDNKLVALSRDTGSIYWISDLNDPDDEDVMWTSPVLAGGRLVIASAEGRVSEYNPQNGELIRNWKTGGGISLMPVVAGETLYLLTNSGTLLAYR